MYPPIPMGINNVGPPTNYQYVNNMYAPPMQNYGYNMGYDYGYQGAGYINPVNVSLNNLIIFIF